MTACTSRTVVVFTCLAMLVLAPCVQAVETTVIENVTVIDILGGKALEAQRVTISADKISIIEPAKGSPPTDAKVIDGRGLYLMPGLFDSHVHYISPDTFGPLCIAHGVTFVRDMGGSTEQILALRDRLNRGEILGPEMIATGAIIDGNPPIWPFSEACNTPDEARAAVRKLAAAGVNQIKVYSKLPREAYLAAIDEAHKHNLKAVGHIPLGATLEDAVTAGQATIEHLEGFDALIAEAAGETLPETRSFVDNFKRWELLPKADKVKLQAFYARMRKSGTAVCPTMVVIKGIGSVGQPEPHDPRLDYVPQFLREFWKGEKYTRMAPGARRVVPLMQAVVMDLHVAGVTLLCGTDLANPYVFAGSSLHEEMALFQEAGVPAPDVLRSATIEPAKLFGVADRLGTVETGKTASLVLLRANPLSNVLNVREVEGVFFHGRYFDRAKLDVLLKEVKGTEPATATAEVKSAELTLPGEVLRRGRYHSKFMEMDAGTEDFIITKTPEGFSIKADLRPRGGPQKPSVGTFHLAPSRHVRAAVWEVSPDASLKVDYVVKDKTIVAKAVESGSEPAEQKLDLPSDWLFSGPFTAVDFANMAALGLSPGQKRTFNNVWFGFPSWRMSVSPVAVERHEDRPIKLANGQELNAAYYTSEHTLPMGKFLGETWLDKDGVVVKSILKMPFGTVVTELE